MGSHAKACVRVVGDVITKLLTWHILFLRDVFYSLEFHQNIISITKLVPHDYEFRFGPKLTIYFNKFIVGSSTMVNGLHVLGMSKKKVSFCTVY